MLLKFKLNSERGIELREVSFIGSDFVIGLHPGTKEKTLFLSNPELLNSKPVVIALHRLEVEVKDKTFKSINGINYLTLRGKDEKTKTENI